MKRTITIKYRWQRSGKKPAVLQKHIEALEEEADDRIREQMAQGFTSGQLAAHVRMDEADGADGVEYQGFWEVVKCTS